MTGHPEVGLFRVNLTRNAHPVLFENSVRPRQQGRNADSSLMWIGSGLQTMLEPFVNAAPLVAGNRRGQVQPLGSCDVLQFVLTCTYRLIKNIRLAVAAAVVQPHARFDEAGSLFCGDRFTTHL